MSSAQDGAEGRLREGPTWMGPQHHAPTWPGCRNMPNTVTGQVNAYLPGPGIRLSRKPEGLPNPISFPSK